MKKLLFAIVFVVASAVVYGQPNPKQDFRKLKWLTGNWKRTDAGPGRNGTETWSVASATCFKGLGVTLKGKDTVSLEKLSLIIKGNDIFYVADVTGNPKPVYFKMTSITGDSFVCENPEHDFPKKISYKLVGDKIEASISGNGKSIPYNFVKM
jgi:hypothetical protein